MAKRLVRLTPNSGAGKIKGDIHQENFLVEHKYTDKGQFVLKRAMLIKTGLQAWNAGKKPKWILTLQGRDYTLLEGIV